MNELLIEYRNLCYKSAKDDITDKELDREDELHEEIDRQLKINDLICKLKEQVVKVINEMNEQ